MSLDLDCWIIVAKHSVDLSIWNLLFVNKTAFRACLRILYRDPFRVQETQARHLRSLYQVDSFRLGQSYERNNNDIYPRNSNNVSTVSATTTLTPFAARRLEHLLALCSGYASYLNDPLPKWENPLEKRLLTTNYLQYVQVLPQMPFSCYLDKDSMEGEDSERWIERLCSHIRFHGSKIQDLYIGHRTLPELTKFAGWMPNLKQVHFVDLNTVNMREKDVDMILKFIETQQSRTKKIGCAGGGTLEQFDMEYQNFGRFGTSFANTGDTPATNWLKFVAIQNAVQRPKRINIRLTNQYRGTIYLCQLPMQRLVEVVLQASPSNTERLDLIPFLKQCSRLEALMIRDRYPKNLFYWAREEFDRRTYGSSAARKGFEVAKEIDLVHDLATVALEPPEIPPLKSLTTVGSFLQPLTDVMYACRSTLEYASVTTRSSLYDDNLTLCWTWRLPNLEHLELNGPTIDFQCLSQFCLGLKTLIWHDKSQPLHLPDNVVHVDDPEYSLPNAIASLRWLERLELIANTTENSRAKLMENDERRPKKEMTNLKHLRLQGQWATMFQGILMTVAPNLETFTLVGQSLRAGDQLDLCSFGSIKITKAEDVKKDSLPSPIPPLLLPVRQNLRILRLARWRLSMDDKAKSNTGTENLNQNYLMQLMSTLPNLEELEFREMFEIEEIKSTVHTMMLHSGLGTPSEASEIFSSSATIATVKVGTAMPRWNKLELIIIKVPRLNSLILETMAPKSLFSPYLRPSLNAQPVSRSQQSRDIGCVLRLDGFEFACIPNKRMV